MKFKKYFNLTFNFLYDNLAVELLITIIAILWYINNDIVKEMITTLWVNPIMSKLSSYTIYISIPYILFLTIVYYHLFIFSKAIYRPRLIAIFIYTFFYLYYYNFGVWNYDKMIADIPWTHLSILPFFLEIGLYVKIYLYKPEKIKSELFIEAIEKTNDTYNRSPLIATVHKTLSTCFTEDSSFSVAITGAWGSGKTTFIQSLKEEIRKTDPNISLLIFEPWKNDSPELIMKSFFSLLSKNLNKYIPHISVPFKEYVELLIDQVPKNYKLAIKTAQKIISSNTKTPFENIKSQLKDSRHKVVIFIDDVDRINANEIKEILRLIRNTANLPYLQFIVAFDKDYVIKCLQNNGINNPMSYLEKFFNLEINLPSIQSRTLCIEMQKRISPIIGEIWDDADRENRIQRKPSANPVFHQ